jgi:hypothetical protein
MALSDPVIARLLAEHAQLLALGANLAALLDQPEPPTAEALSDCRWQIARLLLRHLPVEDRHVFLRLDAHPDPAVRATMAAFRVGLEERYAIYRKHSEQWTIERAIAEWNNYRPSARRQILMLEEGLRKEEEELYPLLDGAPPAPAERSADHRNWAGDAWVLREQLGR